MRRADGTFFSAFFVCLTTPPPAFAVPSSVCNSNFVEAALGWSLEPTAPTVLYTPAAATSSASHALLEQSSSSPIRQGGTGVLERAHAGRKPFKGANGAAHSQEANFIDDLGADSLDQVELVMALEEEFGNEIPEEEAEKLQTVGSVIEYVEKNLAS